MIILLDAGHGESTPGKRSPDGRLREYKYCREIANEVKNRLLNKNIETQLIVTDDTDTPLKQRCSIVNQYCEKYGKNNVILVSIHCNAAGIGADWMNARGWSVFISPNASDKSKSLATCLAKSAERINLKIRRETNDRDYWVSNLYICKNTNCPAVLTENLFQDNKEDVEFLLSEEGREHIVSTHVEGIMQYIELENSDKK